jgi:predicted nucleotidyltransferase
MGGRVRSLLFSSGKGILSLMNILAASQKERIASLGRRYHLRFIILHGSAVKGREREDSDRDIALLGYHEIPLKEFFQIHSSFSDLLGDDERHELDLATLHHVDPFFRYQVIRDGVLLYGDPTRYEEFKAYAYRDFVDSADLRRLELHMTRCKQALLTERYSSHDPLTDA